MQGSFALKAITCLHAANLSHIEHCFTPFNSTMMLIHEIGMKQCELITGNSISVI